MLERWARFVVRRKWCVLAGTLAVVVGVGALSIRFGGDFSDNFRIPGSESQRAFDLLEERFPGAGGSDARIVWRVDEGDIFAPRARSAIEGLLADARRIPAVVAASDPYALPGLISADGRTAFTTVRFQGNANEIAPQDVEALLGLVAAARAPGLRVEAGGEVVSNFEEEGPGESEIFGILAAAVVLLIAFGSIIAAGLPIATALLGLVVGFLLIRFAALALDISSFAPAFAAMLGIGVGIDYALFVVTRHREGLAAGWSVERSVVTAVTTAGRAVLFAGAAVVASLLGLFAVGIPFVANLGLAAAIVVATAVVVALTVLPALLAAIGPAIDRWSLPFLRAGVAGDPAGRWYRFSRVIQRRPWLFLGGGVALLLLFSAPLLDAELGVSDEGSAPESFTSRRAYDLMADAFGPGFNGPFLVVVEDEDGVDPLFVARLRKAVAAAPNVVGVSPSQFNAQGDTAVFTLVPGTAPQDAATRRLVDQLRGDTIAPQVARAAGNPAVFVTGATAAFADVADRIESRLAPFFAIVIGFAVLLLLAAFRSITIPIKAALLNLLAISASIGIVVVVFQWGWAREVIGLGRSGPIESFLPMFLFAILFGLSMDYEVFLVSRIRERFLETGQASEAVAHGISASARVITAAAAILVTVFASFMLSDERVIKEFGFGLAFAILIDATLVRMMLVPASMELMGRWTWYLPRWLDRVLPRISIDPTPVHDPPPPPLPQAPAVPAVPVAPLAGPPGPSAPPVPAVPLVNRPGLRPPPVRRWGSLLAAVVLAFVASYRAQFALHRRND